MAVSMVAAAQEAGARDIHCKINTGNRDWSCAYAGMSLPSLPLLRRTEIKKATRRRARCLQPQHSMRQYLLRSRLSPRTPPPQAPHTKKERRLLASAAAAPTPATAAAPAPQTQASATAKQAPADAPKSLLQRPRFIALVLFCVRGVRTQAGYAIEGVADEVEAIQIVQYHHVEGPGGGSLLCRAPHGYVGPRRVGAMLHIGAA